MDRQDTEHEYWFEKAFVADYLEVYPARTVESARNEALAALKWLSPAPGQKLLDLCCGAGRHSFWLQESQCQLYGVDLSKDLLTEARRHLSEDVSLSRADMRDLPFEQDFFDHVMMFFTSFGYFAGDEENRRVLAEVARVCSPGGLFLLDLPDRATTIEHLIPSSERRVGDRTIREERSMTADKMRVEKTVTITGPGENRNYTESVRLFSREEIETLLQASGWESKFCYGDWDGNGHEDGISPRMIFVSSRVGGNS